MAAASRIILTAIVLVPLARCTTILGLHINTPHINVPMIAKTIQGKVGDGVKDTVHTVKKADEDIGREVATIGGKADDVVNAPAKAVRETGDAIGHIDRAAKSADQTLKNAGKALQNLQPAIQHLDSVARSMDHLVQTAEPVMGKVGKTADKVDGLIDFSKPVLANINQTALSASHLLHTSDAAVGDLNAAVKDARILITDAAAWLRNLTHMMQKLERNADAVNPAMVSLNTSLRTSGEVAQQVNAMVKEFRDAFSVMKYLVGIILCLCICLLIARGLLMARLSFARKSVSPDLGNLAVRGKGSAREMSLLAAEGNSFLPLHNKA